MFRNTVLSGKEWYLVSRYKLGSSEFVQFCPGVAWSTHLGCSNMIVSSSFWKEKVGIALGNPKSMQYPLPRGYWFGKISHIHMEKLEINSDSREEAGRK